MQRVLKGILWYRIKLVDIILFEIIFTQRFSKCILVHLLNRTLNERPFRYVACGHTDPLSQIYLSSSLSSTSRQARCDYLFFVASVWGFDYTKCFVLLFKSIFCCILSQLPRSNFVLTMLPYIVFITVLLFNSGTIILVN